MWSNFNDLLLVGNITEGKGHWNLQKETNGCECVTCESCEAKATHDTWGVCIKCTLRAIVAKRDEEVNPHAPVVLRERLV